MPTLLRYDPSGETAFVRAPLCGHGTTAKTYKSTLLNENKGKHFIRCPEGKGAANDCGYGYWRHQIPTRTE